MLNIPAILPPTTYKSSPIISSTFDLKRAQSLGKMGLMMTMNRAGMLMIIWVTV